MVMDTNNGVTNWPGHSVLGQGFAVGSDFSGNSQMRGVLADLETYNYVLFSDDVQASYNAVVTGAAPAYAVAFASRYTSNAIVTPAISGWSSSSMMILVNSTNYVATNDWVPFDANPTINLGSGDGVRTVNFFFNSLDGLISSYSFRLWLDTTPPTITITSPGPGTNTVDEPLLQLQGSAPEELASVTYDVVNAAGSLSNQPAIVLSRIYDTNQWRFTTNAFQCFDIGLTVGTNAITLHAKDLAGNVTTTNFSYCQVI